MVKVEFANAPTMVVRSFSKTHVINDGKDRTARKIEDTFCTNDKDMDCCVTAQSLVLYQDEYKILNRQMR